MCLYLWISLASTLAMVSSETLPPFKTHRTCGPVWYRLAHNRPTITAAEAIKCVVTCYEETTKQLYDVNAKQCFGEMLQPYTTKVLNKKIPSDAEMQKCVDAKDRSNCRDTIFFYFAKWYTNHYTDAHHRKFGSFLFNTWVNNPDLSHRIPHNNGEHTVVMLLSEINFSSNDDIQAAIKITSPSDPQQFPIIQNELKRHCFKHVTAYTRKFCQLRPVMTIANKIRALAKGKTKYSQNFNKYVGAIKCNFIAYSLQYEGHQASRINPPTEAQKALVIDQQLNILADLTRDGNTRNIETFLQFMPETYLLDKACKQTFFPVLARRSCILAEIVEQLLIYSKMAEKRKGSSSRKAVTINFSLNLRAVITELRGEEVFKMLLDNRYEIVSSQEETASLIEGKFDQLRSYFSKLQSFNMQKARADVDYVKSRIEYYQGKSQTAIDGVAEHVGGVLQAALITQGLEVGEKTIKLTFAIAEACNPFKAVFNGGTATGIMDALSELMTSISRLVEATALKDAWSEVISTVTDINNGFMENSEFLSSVGKIVDKVKGDAFPEGDEFEQSKSTFLTLYTDYTPKVDAEMLEVLATKFDNAVESGCRLIDDASGSAATGYVAYVKENLYCQKAAESTSRMKIIFEEIYNFQFEFIESMAEYLRSSTGYHASKHMVTLTGEPMKETREADKRRSELRANIIMAHTTYEMQKQGALQALCDFLEYKEGGKAPAVCEESTIDVPTLLSYIPKKCKSVNKYVSIPVMTSANVQPGHINIDDLYSGEEVSFDIPSYDWMKYYEWIGQEDNFEAVYIRSFEIFLPTINPGKKEIEVSVKGLGGNRFEKRGIKYSLVPTESFNIDYTGGSRFYPCSGNKIENPYSICETHKLPKLCVRSDVSAFDDAKHLYPTAFARFKIRAKGVTSEQTPDPKTPLDIKAKINMCVFESSPPRKKRSSQKSKVGCCIGNDYWNEEEGSCKPCANDSTSNLNGYYCEKNRNALPPRKTKKKTSS